MLQHIKNSGEGFHASTAPTPPHLYYCGGMNFRARPIDVSFFAIIITYKRLGAICEECFDLIITDFFKKWHFAAYLLESALLV